MNINKNKSTRKSFISSKTIFPAIGAFFLATQTGCNGLDKRLGMVSDDGIESEMHNGSSGPGGNLNDRLNTINDKLNTIEDRLNTIEDKIDRLQNEVDTMKNKLSPPPPPPLPSEKHGNANPDSASGSSSSSSRGGSQKNSTPGQNGPPPISKHVYADELKEKLEKHKKKIEFVPFPTPISASKGASLPATQSNASGDSLLQDNTTQIASNKEGLSKTRLKPIVPQKPKQLKYSTATI